MFTILSYHRDYLVWLLRIPSFLMKYPHRPHDMHVHIHIQFYLLVDWVTGGRGKWCSNV